MNTYEALLREISAMQSARDSVPSDLDVRALFDLVIMRLSDYAEVIGGHMDAFERDRCSRGEVGASRPFNLGVLSDLSFARRNDSMDGGRA